MVTLSVSTRVSPELHKRLITEAQTRGLPLGTLTRDLLTAALDGAAFNAPAAPGPLTNEVDCLFHDLPPEAGIRREVCMSLAKTAEAGGMAGVTAGEKLVYLTDVVRRLYVPEPEDDEDDDPPR